MADPKRNKKGQWLKGQSGNTTGVKRIAFTNKMLNSVTQKDVKEVILALTAKAKAGDLRAIKLFLQYIVNQPVLTVEQTVEVDTRSPEDIRKEFKAAFTSTSSGVKI